MLAAAVVVHVSVQEAYRRRSGSVLLDRCGSAWCSVGCCCSVNGVGD